MGGMGSGTPMPALPRFSRQHGHASTPESVRQLQPIEEPLYPTIAAAAAEAVTDEQLIAEDRRQQHGAIVVQTAVPDLIFELKEMLEPLIEWLDGLFSARIKIAAPPAVVEALPLLAVQSFALALAFLNGLA